MVFAPDADVSWIKQASIISVKAHDQFASQLGLEVRLGVPACSLDGARMRQRDSAGQMPLTPWGAHLTCDAHLSVDAGGEPAHTGNLPGH